MMEMIRFLTAFFVVIRADVIMNPFVMIWDAIGGRMIAIWLVTAVVTVTAVLIWLLKRKKKGE